MRKPAPLPTLGAMSLWRLLRDLLGALEAISGNTRRIAIATERVAEALEQLVPGQAETLEIHADHPIEQEP